MIKSVANGRNIRIAIQIAVSAGLLGFIAWLAHSNHVVEKLREMPPSTAALALGLMVTGTAFNALRWKLLLQNAGIEHSFLKLWKLYLIGMFFSMFLPTGTGGDAVRIYDLTRAGGKMTMAIVATLQERLVGLGSSLVLGFVAVIYYFHVVPPPLRLGIFVLVVCGVVGVGMFLYPASILRVMGGIWKRIETIGPLTRLRHSRIGHRFGLEFERLMALSPMKPARLISVLAAAMVGILFTISSTTVLAHKLGMPDLNILAFCLVIPLVWILSMAPSLGGLGVREAGIVGLLGAIFHVAKGTASTLAVAMLALTFIVSLIGGLIFLLRLATGGGLVKNAANTSTNAIESDAIESDAIESDAMNSESVPTRPS